MTPLSPLLSSPPSSCGTPSPVRECDDAEVDYTPWFGASDSEGEEVDYSDWCASTSTANEAMLIDEDASTCIKRLLPSRQLRLSLNLARAAVSLFIHLLPSTLQNERSL